uniref:Polyamine-modulated factor 1 n=1 Tax=Ciona savignyi TaxID=51511 RepID=H2ZMH8_CIOSA
MNTEEDTVPPMVEDKPGPSETCERFQNFQKCLGQFVKSIRDKPGTCRKLARSFPKYYKSNAEVVQVVSDQLWEAFEEKQLSNMEQFIREANLKKLLYNLSIANVDENFNWRPSGDPDEDIQAHLFHAKQRELAKLTEIHLKEINEANALEEEIKAKELNVRKLLAVGKSQEKELEKVKIT